MTPPHAVLKRVLAAVASADGPRLTKPQAVSLWSIWGRMVSGDMQKHLTVSQLFDVNP